MSISKVVSEPIWSCWGWTRVRIYPDTPWELNKKSKVKIATNIVRRGKRFFPSKQLISLIILPPISSGNNKIYLNAFTND
jgi:hypothetical protein